MRFLTTLLTALTIVSASAQKVQIFEDTHIDAASKHPNMEADNKGEYHAAAGRLVFKKVTLPTFKNSTKATINLTLASIGDRWDKSGSCFVIPANAENDLWKVINGESQFPQSVEAVGTQMKGHALLENYKPAVELLRFMTPFGVGFYSDNHLNRQPVYIDHWAENVQWSQDISQLISELQGEVIVGVWVDSWDAEGYSLDMDITFEQSQIKGDKMKKTEVIPLFNTVYYIGENGSPTMFADQEKTTVEFSIPKEAKNAKLYYITTGHGGHSGGDEFTPVQNIVQINGETVIDFTPWRTDCASFRRFNPGSGVWLIKRKDAPYIGRRGEYETKDIEESLASSDLSRSNWCPGSCIVPESVSIDLTTGVNTFSVMMPTAQKADGNKYNHWLVSAYIVYQK
ncbi:MAG: PNGase F N-terminal domain-containing protein [Rikenellaceae bacterium]